MRIGELYKSVPEEGFHVLVAIESGLPKYEYVPVRYIMRKTRLPPKKLDLVLGFLNSKKMVVRQIGHEVGYRLTYLGLDMIALNALVKRGVLLAIGDKIGVGKESDIYEALGPGDIRLAIKFHRVGRRSFRRTVLLRPYVLERETSNWMIESKLSAQREYRALTELSLYTKYVPRPIAYNRHAVVTEFIEGLELYRIHSLSDAESILYKIIEVINVAYNKLGIVHGDLSEYNIIIRYPDEEPSIIDWPQYFYREHPSAKELLRRDVFYVVRYFNKRFKLEIDWEEIYKRILNGEYST